MTENERADLRRLHEAATPGPWVHTTDAMTGSEWGYIRPGVSAAPLAQMWRNHGRLMPDAEFIAAARTAVPALLDEVEGLRAVLVELEVYAPDWYDCDHCSLLVPRPADNEGHAADCPVTRARALLDEDR